MSKEEEVSYSNIVSVNPYTDEYFSGISSLLVKNDSVQFSKKQLVASYINSREYISNTIEISKNIPDEDLLDAINIKIYDDFGLDQTIEYQVQYIETFDNANSENRSFQIFIVDPTEINERFKDVISKIKYIDIITPAPLLIKTLYAKEIIEDNGVHCFIYFEQNDTFVTVYKEKEFLYSKTLKYSLLEMYERFCEIFGDRIEYEEFIEFLQNEHLKFTSSEFKSSILKLYKEIFSNINDVLNSQNRMFNVKSIDHLYIGSQIEIVSKLYELCEFELHIESSDFHFDYGFDQSETYIDQMHALMHATVMLDETEKYPCNFSTFHRPPKFTQRESGKLILLTAASFFIAFAYPITYWVLFYTQELQHEILKSSYAQVHKEKVNRESAIKSKVAEKEKALVLLHEEEKQYNEKKNTLMKIHQVKVNYPMKAKILTALTKDLNKYKVNLEEIGYSEKDTKELTLKLLSDDDKKITELIEYLTKTYRNKYRLSLESISYVNETKRYSGELKVKL